MRTQRKIYHLLRSEGTGRDFRYLPELNPKLDFDFNAYLLLTDKIDGTTVQANINGVFQRRDNFKKGDPRKHTATEEERYRLEKLGQDEPQNKYIFEAIEPYMDAIKKLSAEETIYFEAFGEKIARRYRGINTHDVRVFDYSLRDKFADNFSIIQSVANKLQMPHVRLVAKKFKDVAELIMFLQNAEHQDPMLNQYELEGWVVRQGNKIAKIRKSDLKKLLEENSQK